MLSFREIVRGLFRPTNVLKIRTLPRFVWRDRDEIMLHACFQILVDYVEREDPDVLDVSDDFEVWVKPYLREAQGDTFAETGYYPGEREALTEQHDHQKTLRDLYRWWKVDYPVLRSSDDPPDDLVETEQAMLLKLLGVRPALWT